MPTRLGIRIVAIGVGSVAYVVGTHWLMTRPGGSPWNVVGVLSPMLLAVAFGAWQAGQRLLAFSAAGIVGAVCLQAAFGVRVSAQALYVAQHMGIHLFLAVLFGSTLRAGRKPLITTLAERVHRVFTLDMVAYTRKVTLAWTLYFIAMAAASLLLYAFASFEAWALFANLLTPLALVAMFGGEYVLRYRLHPEFERTSMAAAVRSYMQGPGAP
ncbi:MAG: hypothetical protein H7337_06610 [Rhizobacter sp.]|nr:hypothetical protein [Rhizobacter sp.]